MLKVVYDAANEMEGAAQTEAAAQALFEDDDTVDDEPSITGKSYKSGYSLECGTMNHSQITWAMMLRQLKSEFKDVGYAQAPKITTTRKIDLNKPFSLAPENFDPKKNMKRSLLIGCNYKNIPGAELKASHDDIRSMKVRSYHTWTASFRRSVWSYACSPLPRLFLSTGLHCECSWLSGKQ
jgi:hypothetical protein